MIQSKKDESNYTGVTADIRRRIKEHNGGGARYSSTKAPFIFWAVSLADRVCHLQ
ncbi:MAG: GIY-YIG nuclease family protein [Candidatus Wildermuthbacteria bacterium]|nr:GIY-YIG nuclease family protein [Candidatus Wildermuthbacteria bacterium]